MFQQRLTREDKVSFLRTPYDNGQRLNIPNKLKYANMIDPMSLPECQSRGEQNRPEPDPEVFDIPESYWPIKDAELVPSYMGAEEVWNSCRRGTRGRFKSESVKRREEIGDIIKEDKVSSDPAITVSVSYSAEIEGALRKLERLPSMCREDAIKDMRPDFSEQDYKIIRSESHQRFKTYIEMLKKTYGEREVGSPPDTEDPRKLTRELKSRIENKTNNSEENGEEISQRRRRCRKQQFPVKNLRE